MSQWLARQTPDPAVADLIALRKQFTILSSVCKKGYPSIAYGNVKIVNDLRLTGCDTVIL